MKTVNQKLSVNNRNFHLETESIGQSEHDKQNNNNPHQFVKARVKLSVKKGRHKKISNACDAGCCRVGDVCW